MQDNVKQGWEIFCDTSYFDMWCIRKEGDKRWGAGVHVVNQDGAEAVRDYILASTAQPEVKALVEAVERSAKMIDKAASAAVDQDSPALAEALDNIEFRLRLALAAYHEAQP